ncbi:MAG: transposase family protein, partial [Chromatiales bacterium]
ENTRHAMGRNSRGHFRSNYLIIVDYYSKFIEIDKIENYNSAATIDALKSQMSRHGIAEKLKSDNGTRFSSREFALF